MRFARHALSLVAAIAFGAAAFGLAQPVEACTPGRCQGGFLLPKDNGNIAVLPQGQGVSLVWQPRAWGQSRTPKPSDVTLTEVGSGSTIDVTLKQFSSNHPKIWFVRPEQELQPNKKYRLKTQPICQSPQATPLTTTFRTDKGKVFFPAPRITLKAEPQRRGSLRVPHGASCSASIQAAQIPLKLELGAQAKKWADILMYETHVIDPSGNDRVWDPRHSSVDVLPPGESWEGRERDLLYASCQGSKTTPDGLKAGETYRVYVKARLPGLGNPWESNQIEVTLRCNPPNADVGVDAGPSDTGPSVDVARPDVAPPPDDASPQPDTLPPHDVGPYDTRPRDDGFVPRDRIDTGTVPDTTRDEDASGGDGDVGALRPDTSDDSDASPDPADPALPPGSDDPSARDTSSSEAADNGVVWNGGERDDDAGGDSGGCSGCSSGGVPGTLRLPWLFLFAGLVWRRRRTSP